MHDNQTNKNRENRKSPGFVRRFRRTRFAATACALVLLLTLPTACNRGEEESGAANADAASEEKSMSIAVFVPGVVSGSPLYESLVAGVRRAASESEGTTVKVVEGGFNQGKWSDGVTSLAAGSTYDLIVTSNPALPEICAGVAEQFPEQRFLVLDGYLEGNEAIYTLLYNQMQQAYLIGHMGGLVTTSDLSGANEELKAGLIAAQEYPIMNRVIKVGYELGLKRVNPDIALDFRVIGNWYDATRAAELAASMYGGGVDVILAIAGNANQGVLSESKQRGSYVLWFDSNGYEEAPGVVIGSSALDQARAAYEKTRLAIEGELPYGTADIVEIQEGFVRFIEDDPLYIEHVPEDLRERQHAVIEELESGRLTLEMPVF